MPLTLITGPANAAKVGAVLERLRAARPRDPLLVVPTAADVSHYQRELASSNIVFGAEVLTFARLIREPQVTWHGLTRAPLTDASVYPPLGAAVMPVWVGVGGSPQSVIRVVRHDLQLMLAIIGGDPRRFRPSPRSPVRSWSARRARPR